MGHRSCTTGGGSLFERVSVLWVTVHGPLALLSKANTAVYYLVALQLKSQKRAILISTVVNGRHTDATP